ncbi:hypothetical protein KGD83_28305 [Nocardiopsis akebiae]|uniref:Uncharacterized protein n=1 Tax=Nocardiopsis akebiae TaxID=2831968 RepID=A0ABX8C6C8_9ACTN|nr:hypothetical protein [Nocardiopsis akebiae]QUX29039.1 hypothetical protein KGD83_28305 [Nocardiopsis akebiae]
MFRARNLIRSQNRPRLFAYLVFGTVLLPLWLILLIPAGELTDSRAQFLAHSGVGLVLVVGATVLFGELVARGVRRSSGYVPLPANADPYRLATAEKLVEEGVLCPDPATNWLARIMAERRLREYGIRFPRRTSAFWAVAASAQTGLLVWWLTTDGLSVQTVLLFFTILVNVLLVLLHPTMAARDRRCAEAVRDAYDHHAAEG